MRIGITLAVAASALALTSCNKATESKVDSASIERQIRDLETQWGKDYDSRNAEGLAGHYADDAAIANPGAPLAADTAARREAINGVVSDPALDIKFASDRIEVVLQSIVGVRLDQHAGAVVGQCRPCMLQGADGVTHIVQAIKEAHQVVSVRRNVLAECTSKWTRSDNPASLVRSRADWIEPSW